MTETNTLTSSPYALGAPIDLPDLLALPPDGRNYARDSRGRLTLMSPDDGRTHGFSLAVLTSRLGRSVRPPHFVAQECAIAFDRIYDLRGNLLRASFLGPRAILPDVACFSRRPEFVTGPHRLTFFAPRHLALIVEILSPGTWRSDLGIGNADDVDRMKTSLATPAREYWLLTPAVDEPDCPVPIRGGRFLARAAGAKRWQEIPIPGGIVHSRAIPELTFDPADFWNECGI